MLTDAVKSRISFDEFAVQWKKTADERRHRATALREGVRENPDLGERAKIEYADGKSVFLRREGGAWRLESALIARTHAGHPHDAVQILAESLQKRDYDALMRILTARRRDAISERVDGFATSLSRHLASRDNTIEFTGDDRAELRWDDEGLRYRVVLHKEGDQWRIDDIHIRPAPERPEDEDASEDTAEEAEAEPDRRRRRPRRP